MMFGNLVKTFGGFAKERAGSLVSKKLGAALGAEALLATANPSLQGTALIAYIVVQGLVDISRHYFNSHNSLEG